MEKENQAGLKAAVITILLSGVVCAIAALTLNNNPSEFITKILGICLSVLYYGLLGVLCFSICSNIRTMQLGLTGAVICFVGFVLSAVAIIFEIKNESFSKMLISFSLISIAMAQISMLYKIRIINKFAAISRIVAVIAVAVFTLMMVVAIMGNLKELQYMFMRSGAQFLRTYLAVLSIDLAATAATPLLNRMHEGRLIEEDLAAELLQEPPPQPLTGS
jgi:hypothetical protein